MEDLSLSRKESLNNLIENKNRSNQKITFLNNLLNKLYLTSFFYKKLLKFFGISIGENINFNGPLNFILNGPIKNITIKNNVTFGKNVTLKIRENGKIEIGDKVYLDDNVRLVSARDGFIKIEEGTEIGANTILNSGGNLTIGKFCLISNNCNINSSSHATSASNYIMDQSHLHGYVNIKNDVWLGGFVTVTYNTTINEGAIIGANSLVTKDIDSLSINYGSPSEKISNRS
tara:strand:+ start:425 stop:1117 length:693 start_codon:yes stop_codon:yes gene_type:complete